MSEKQTCTCKTIEWESGYRATSTIEPDCPIHGDRDESGDGYTLDELISFAVECHRGQVYPGLGKRPDQPFIMHVMRVVEAVSHEARPAAALHDCLEDAGRLPNGLDEVTLKAVYLLSHMDGEPYMEYIEAIATAEGEAGRIAQEVKVADLTTNLRHDPWNILGKRHKYEAAYWRLTGKRWSGPQPSDKEHQDTPREEQDDE